MSDHEARRPPATPPENELPLDPTTHQPIQPRPHPGYYPGFSTLAQKESWDQSTRDKVMKRVQEVPPLRFFSEAEARTFQAILDRILPQTDRTEDHKIPLLHLIDDRLHNKRFDGYVYEGLQEDDETHRMGLKAIDETSVALHGRGFAGLGPAEQEHILISIKDGKPVAEHAIWKKLPPAHYWNTVLQDAISAYYAHPYAWDEIGFGGPAYPRGYMRLTDGLPEPWESREKRYSWSAPEFTQSDRYHENEEIFSKPSRHGQPGNR